MNKPPFNITNIMLNKCISITEKVGTISSFQSLKRMPILRRNNKIQSIHSSLMIEANSLSLEQVFDVIDGKNVLGPLNEILEVKNAFDAYSKIESFDPYSESDLLLAHRILSKGLIDDSGKYRNHGEGVYNGEILVHLAPSHQIVPGLMKELFSWLNEDDDTHLLIKSCIFHYEFVFIHPFTDGNGRTARLWQNVLLSKWNSLFEYIPFETYIAKYQSEYYNAIKQSNISGTSNCFIEFMLKVIDETLDNIIISLKKESLNISDQVNKLLSIMDKDIPLSGNEIMERLNIKSKETLRGSYLNPAIENGLIKMTLPDKPNSKNQRYVKL